MLWRRRSPSPAIESGIWDSGVPRLARTLTPRERVITPLADKEIAGD